ncbi:MAG: hypothetical protein ACE5GY_10270 [Thermodesulfobacteriota bacterium]
MELFSHQSLLLLGAFAIFLIVAVGAILVLWVAMPFSVFGMKGLLKRSVEEQEETNRLLRSILEANLSRAEPYDGRGDAVEKRENTH